jgi:hypothetical protein
MLTEDDFRTLALAFPGALEGGHMGHVDFRRGKRIFATLGYPHAGVAMVKLTPGQQAMLTGAEPAIFAPVRGGWGLKGATLIHLAAADAATARSALDLAWANLAGKR